MKLTKKMTLAGIEARDIDTKKFKGRIVEVYLLDEESGDMLLVSCGIKEATARALVKAKGTATLELHRSGYRILVQLDYFEPDDMELPVGAPVDKGMSEFLPDTDREEAPLEPPKPPRRVKVRQEEQKTS